MTMSEWFIEYEMKAPKDKGETFAGKLTRSDVEELKEFIKNDTG